MNQLCDPLGWTPSFIQPPKRCNHIALCDSPVGPNSFALTWLFSTRDTLFQQEMYAFGYEAIKPSAGAESESVHLKESFLFRERHPQ